MKFLKDNKKSKLLKKEKQLIQTINYYEILDEMIKNQEDGKIPKMPIYRRKELKNWLMVNKPKNDKMLDELELIRKELL